MSDKQPPGSLLSAMLLVGGTCIGGGMLALPVVTGAMGFVPSLFVMAICWIAMTCTGLLLLEATLWMHEGAHVISMASRFLGPLGKSIAWIFYLFICYASIIAYTAGGGVQIAAGLGDVFQVYVSKPVGCAIFTAIFGLIIYLGTHVIGRVNVILFSAMILSYFGLIGLGLPEVHADKLSRTEWGHAYLAVPLLLTSFSFQTLVPSLAPFLNRNAKQLRWAIIGGTTIAFLVYIVWQALILGIIPVDGPHGLVAALIKGEPATQFLREATHNPWTYYVAEYFAFFALVTSFLGIAMGLLDFLSDGLRIPKRGMGKVWLGLLIFVPTLAFAITNERAFLVALETSGGFGDSVLNGILPVLMVWVGRYHLGLGGGFGLPGGKIVLILLLLFYVTSGTLETFVHLGILPNQHEIVGSLDFIDENLLNKE